jgi:hypothetical protein
MRTIGIAVALALVAAACSSGDGGNPDGGNNPDSGGNNPDGQTNPDGGQPSGTCGQATLFAGNPFFGESDHDPNSGDDPAQRPADGANMLTGIPYHYQLLHFGGAQILTNDQQSVWSVDASAGVLHPVAGDINGNAHLKAGPCASAMFADLLGSAVAADGTMYVADYANAVLKITNPLNAGTCTVAYFAGTATELASPSLDGTDGSSGTNDGTGAAAQFEGPESLTIDSTGNLYLLDGAASAAGSWSVRKITPGAVVTTLATFAGGTFAYGELQFLNGKVYFWARGNDANNQDTANLIAVDASATSPVADPPSILTLHGADLNGDSTGSFDVGGITTDGTKLYVVANSQLFSVDVSGTPKISKTLAGEDDDNFDPQSDLDFDWTDNYSPSAAHSALQVELLGLDETQTLGIISYLSRDSSGNIYFTAESEDAYVEKIAGCP